MTSCKTSPYPPGCSTSARGTTPPLSFQEGHRWGPFPASGSRYPFVVPPERHICGLLIRDLRSHSLLHVLDLARSIDSYSSLKDLSGDVSQRKLRHRTNVAECANRLRYPPCVAHVPAHLPSRCLRVLASPPLPPLPAPRRNAGRSPAGPAGRIFLTY
jgi:hypothetical protein